MWVLLAALLTQVQAEPARPGKGPTTTSAANLLEGPLKIEMVGLGERRTLESLEASSASARMRLQFRLRGAEMARIKRYGSLVLTEVTDDLGNNLLPEAPDATADTTRRLEGQALAKLAESGLSLGMETKAAPRAARKLAVIRGHVRAVFGDEPESIFIDDPRGFMGRTIDHPRLKELGVEIRVLGQGDIPQLSSSNRHVPIQFVRGEDMIDEIAYCDPWLKPIRFRHYRNMKTTSNELCQVYLAESDITAEYCMVIRVYPRVRDEKIMVELHDVVLP